MGNYSIVIVLAGSLGLALMVNSTRMSVSGADQRLGVQTQKTTKSREASWTGLNLTVRRLATDTTSWKSNPSAYEFTDQPYRGASFTTHVAAPYQDGVILGTCIADTVDVVSIGFAESVAGQIPHEIEATYARNCDGAPSEPEAFAYPLFSEKEMRLEGGVKVYSADADLNANIHSNDQLVASGEYEVQGYGTYVTPGGKCDPCNGFLPNDDINGADPNTYQSERQEIPEVSADDYYAKKSAISPGTVKYETDTVIDFTNHLGETGYGTEENPFVWIIEGDLIITANVQTSGYAIIVTTGWVQIGSEAKLYSSAPPGQYPPPSSSDFPNEDAVRAWMAANMPNGTTLGIYATGTKEGKEDGPSFEIGGKATVVGQMYGKGPFEMPGDATVFGSVATHGNLKGTGKFMVWFAEPDDAINELTATNTSTGELTLLGFSEW